MKCLFRACFASIFLLMLVILGSLITNTPSKVHAQQQYAQSVGGPVYSCCATYSCLGGACFFPVDKGSSDQEVSASKVLAELTAKADADNGKFRIMSSSEKTTLQRKTVDRVRSGKWEYDWHTIGSYSDVASPNKEMQRIVELERQAENSPVLMFDAKGVAQTK